MSKRKRATRKLTETLKISKLTYDRLFAVAMEGWEIEKLQLKNWGVDPKLLNEVGATEKEIRKSIMSTAPHPETVINWAIHALKKDFKEWRDDASSKPIVKASSQKLN